MVCTALAAVQGVMRSGGHGFRLGAVNAGISRVEASPAWLMWLVAWLGLVADVWLVLWR